MTSPQLLDYVRQQLAAGVSNEVIKQTLVTQGWNEQDIREAFGVITPSPSTSSPVLQAVPRINPRSNKKTWIYWAAGIGGGVMICTGLFLTGIIIFLLPVLPYIVSAFAGFALAYKTNKHLGFWYSKGWQKLLFTLASYFIFEFLVRKIALIISYPFLATLGDFTAIIAPIEAPYIIPSLLVAYISKHSVNRS